MIEVSIPEDVFRDLGNETLCALHTLKVLRDAGIPVVGCIGLAGVETGTLEILRDESSPDGDEYVYLYRPNGQPPEGGQEFRFHEDDLFKTPYLFTFADFVMEMGKVIPMRFKLSPHAPMTGVLTMWRDETLNGDEYVFTWTPDDEL